MQPAAAAGTKDASEQLMVAAMVAVAYRFGEVSASDYKAVPVQAWAPATRRHLQYTTALRLATVSKPLPRLGPYAERGSSLGSFLQQHASASWSAAPKASRLQGLHDGIIQVPVQWLEDNSTHPCVCALACAAWSLAKH
jgi:hypothetical protein